MNMQIRNLVREALDKRLQRVVNEEVKYGLEALRVEIREEVCAQLGIRIEDHPLSQEVDDDDIRDDDDAFQSDLPPYTEVDRHTGLTREEHRELAQYANRDGKAMQAFHAQDDNVKYPDAEKRARSLKRLSEARAKQF